MLSGDYHLSVFVNGTKIAEAQLDFLPMRPPLSGRFVLEIGYVVKEGDDITATLVNIYKSEVRGPITFTAEVSILGELGIRDVEGASI